MVRPARDDDIPAVLELWGEARSAAAVTPDSVPAVERLLDHSPDGLLVAESDGRVVGALVAAWDGWRGNMYRLAVLPEYRRRGIARRLPASFLPSGPPTSLTTRATPAPRSIR